MTTERGELSVLVERVLGGESSAWHELWHRVEPLVWGISGKWQVTGPLCKRTDDRRDIVLRVMERLREADFRRLRGFAASAGRGSDNAFRAWLLTLSARVAVDHVRAHPEHLDARGRRGTERWAKLVALDGIPELAEERDLTRRTTALRLLERAREELSVQQLTALSIWLDGATTAVIAERLGLSDPSAGLRVLRAALKRLRDRYRDTTGARAEELPESAP
jgi:DNA-directed RNA polymerase specialized sigma24 family protein